MAGNEQIHLRATRIKNVGELFIGAWVLYDNKPSVVVSLEKGSTGLVAFVDVFEHKLHGVEYSVEWDLLYDIPISNEIINTFTDLTESEKENLRNAYLGSSLHHVQYAHMANKGSKLKIDSVELRNHLTKLKNDTTN